MVRLHEFQGKLLLKEANIKVPEGYEASTEEETKKIANKIGRPVAVKAQVWATGRLKAGGIKFADNPAEAASHSRMILEGTIKGIGVEKVLVEEKLDIDREFYVGVVTDGSWKVKGPVVIFSTKGGVGIEKLAERYPDKVARLAVDYLEGINDSTAQSLVSQLDVPTFLVKPISEVVLALYELFVKYDARVLEINPLVLTRGGQIIAADCRITLDDNSVFRHPEFHITIPRDMDRPPTDLEKMAWRIEEGDYRGTAYFTQINNKVEGGISLAFHGIGGGGAMLAADALIRKGFKIANYADTSGDPTAAKVYRIVKTVLAQPRVEGYIMMGSVLASQEQWHHAHALVKALREEGERRPGFPVLILIAGNKESEAHDILRRGLRNLPLRWELYGRDHIYEIDFIADRVKSLVEDYRKEKSKEG